jgi:hypothetical protein
VHWQYSNNLTGQSPLYFGQEYKSLEAGFHFLLAITNTLGTPYQFMFEFFPSIITSLICLASFILTRKIWNETAGLYSVLFIALLQSSVAILGPVFLVPMALGLFFILIGLYLTEINSSLWFIVLAFLLVMHPPTALAFFVLINIKFLINRESYWKNIPLQALAGLIALPLYLETFMSKGVDSINSLSFTTIVPALFIPRYIGWFSVIFILIGIYFSVGDKKYQISAYILALFFFILVFYQLEIEIFIPYARDLMYLFMIFAIIFGIGCERVIQITTNKKWGIFIGLLIFILFLIFSLPAKLESNKYLYQVMDEMDAQAFNWIKENTSKDEIVLLEPWKANAFTPLAERKVYSRIVQGPNKLSEEKNSKADLFLKGNCTDTNFLEQNNITLIYGYCNNSNLKEVYTNVYLR